MNILQIDKYFYLKGGAIDYEKVYNTVINDLKSASLGKVTFDRL